VKGYLTKYNAMKNDQLKTENWELKEENKQLHDKNDRLKMRIKELEAHIELQKAEILLLQQRAQKSEELKEVFAPPKTKNVKSVEIDNRNT
jgi:predicted nuclease with TOPRIM domain